MKITTIFVRDKGIDIHQSVKGGFFALMGENLITQLPKKLRDTRTIKKP
jgi:hypothetical protein